jgi:hypothetical protein
LRGVLATHHCLPEGEGAASPLPSSSSLTSSLSSSHRAAPTRRVAWREQEEEEEEGEKEEEEGESGEEGGYGWRQAAHTHRAAPGEEPPDPLLAWAAARVQQEKRGQTEEREESRVQTKEREEESRGQTERVWAEQREHASRQRQRVTLSERAGAPKSKGGLGSGKVGKVAPRHKGRLESIIFPTKQGKQGKVGTTNNASTTTTITTTTKHGAGNTMVRASGHHSPSKRVGAVQPNKEKDPWNNPQGKTLQLVPAHHT